MTIHPEQQYLDLLKNLLENGKFKGDRTGTGTLQLWGQTMRFDLSDGTLPMFTTKKLHLKSIIHELLWFLRGETNVRSLQEVGVTIWDEWADENGDLGPIYGKQWRAWEAPNGETIDQIANVIDMMKKTPDSRRILFHGWNPADIKKMALPPCHLLYQWSISDGRLSGILFQRSADSFLGVPYNTTSGCLLLAMLADLVGLERGEFVWVGADTHLYVNHVEQARTQIGRQPYPFPTLRILNRHENIEDYKFEDFEIVGYQSHPAIKAPVAI